MEHNTDRILWTVLVLAIGVALYVSFKPAANGLLGQGIEKIQDVATNVDSDIGLVDKDDNSPFTYQYDTNAKTATITNYKPKSGDALPAKLEIPAYKKHDGVKYTVTSIGETAFNSKPASAQGFSVTLPDTIKTIDAWAFYNTKLTSVDLPSGLKSIGNRAFSKTSLTSVDLPSGLTSIGLDAFADTPLTSVHLPDSLTSISDEAFEYTKLTSVDLPSGLTSIGGYAFSDTKLISVHLPDSLISIGNAAFYNTPISAISFKKRVDLGGWSFHQTNLKNVTLPTGSTYKADGDYPTFDPSVKVTIK